MGSSILKKPLTLEHDVLWEVLKDQGLHPDYIDIIKRCSEPTISLVARCEARRSGERFVIHRCNGTMLPFLEKTLEKCKSDEIWSIFRYCH